MTLAAMLVVLAAPVVAPGLAVVWAPGHADGDDDGDGVLNWQDRCWQEPGSSLTAGCTVDSDGDGLLDVDDLCPTQPETWNGYFDGDGCPDPDGFQGGGEAAGFHIGRVVFEGRSAEVTAVAWDGIQWALQMLAHGGPRVEAIGRAAFRVGLCRETGRALGLARWQAVRARIQPWFPALAWEVRWRDSDAWACQAGQANRVMLEVAAGPKPETPPLPDADGDEVPDGRDACPGVAEDRACFGAWCWDGCPEPDWRSRVLFFSPGDATLSKVAKRKLARMRVDAGDGAVWRLEGHAGMLEVGPEAGAVTRADDLGLARAEAVAGWLVAEGVPRERIRVGTWGLKRPRVATPYGEQRDWGDPEPDNQRVAVRWGGP